MKSNRLTHTLEPSVGPQYGRGFTLIEILLSLALMGVIAGFSVPLYQSFQNQNQLQVTATTMTQTLRRAQVLSQANDGDSRWGVYVETGAITLFQGDDFSDRNSALDERFDIPESLSIDGDQEFVFKKLSGLPSAEGATTFTGPANRESTVSINSQGMVQY